MTVEEIIEYCLRFKGAYADFPFGDVPMCIRVHGKIFAQIYSDKMTLKCEAIAGDYYRETYRENVERGYHCPPVQQPYFITVKFMPVMLDDILKEMITSAYKAVIKNCLEKYRRSLTKNNKLWQRYCKAEGKKRLMRG